ncbi:MAG: glycosyltransferase [Chloroflexi bacterium]|nr:glycosyltransferase [Chloroflexota bacterium]
MQNILFSIIIPTFNRPDLLKSLLESIFQQEPIQVSYEIIVIDNYPVPLEPVKNICKEYENRGMSLHLLHQPKPGVSNARNMGIQESIGDWLVFIDDDEELRQNYVKNVLSSINNSDRMSVFGGQCLAVLDPGAPRWIKKEYFYVGYGELARPLHHEEYFGAGNMIFSRELLEKIGPFTAALGHTGNNTSYGEDTDLCFRAVAAGATQYYLPDLVIYHHIPLERMSLNFFKRKKRESAKFKALSYLDQNGSPKNFISIWRLKTYYLRVAFIEAFRILLMALKNVFRDRKKFRFWQNYYIECVIQHYARFWINLVLSREINPSRKRNSTE